MRTNRVVDEIQHETRVFVSVPFGIQSAQRLYGFFVHPAAALFLDILQQVTGKAGNHFDTHRRQEGWQVLLSGLHEHREVTAVQHLATIAPRLFHQKAKRGIQFWSAAGNVYRPCLGGPDELERQLGSPPIHDFCPFRACLYMTMQAGLITEFADIDLDSVKVRACQKDTLAVESCGK